MKERSDWMLNACRTIVRAWPVSLGVWVVGCVLMVLLTPAFSEIADQGEFDFLPADVASRQAEAIFREAFGKDVYRSLVVISVRRTTRPEGLTSNEDFEEQDRDRKSDFEFIENDLKPAMLELLQNFQLEEDWVGSKVTGESPYADAEVTTYTDKLLGPMLISKDRQASLVLVELANDFMDVRNAYLMNHIEELLYENPEFRSMIPPGLEITLSGTATVGRDMNLAAFQSAKATEKVTILLVIVLLLIIYRAPILALIPLLTVMLVIQITLGTITTLAQLDWLGTFQSMDIYVIVVVYGAGVDYCLFLIARYREELESGLDYETAIARALRYTVAPLVGSAGTSIVGIGMMVFTEYKKFQQVGIGISLGLTIALIASITLTPAFLRIFGKWSFWPNIPQANPGQHPGWIARASLMQRFLAIDWTRAVWRKVAYLLAAFPGLMWLVFTALMVPFVVVAIFNFNNLSYGLLSELPEETRGVVGTRAVREHFPAGTLGPTTILLVNRGQNFLQEEQVQKVGQLCEALYAEREKLGLLDIFSSTYPLGMTPEGRQQQQELEDSLDGPRLVRAAKRAGLRSRVMQQYVGGGSLTGPNVTRIDLVFDRDPFHQDSIRMFERTLAELHRIVPEFLEGKTDLHALGSTASIRDMKQTTDRDQIRVAVLVLVSVYLFLVVLLRKPAISAYLIVTVFVSYLATLGVTITVFWALDPENFAGIDWKVRMFLFTILIAIGEDYNIFLVTRVDEEREHHSPVKGVLQALTKTGSIISSCGLIMAGTFCALMAGSLVGMQQLGFALAFGVLLDTFIIRPILVPAYMILLERGLFGRYSQFFGAIGKPKRPVPEPEPDKLLSP